MLPWLLALGGLGVGIPVAVKQHALRSSDAERHAAATSSSKLAERLGKAATRDRKAPVHDPAAIATALGSADRETAATALEVLLPDLTKRDLPAAAELAQGLDPWAQRQRALLFVAGAWASSDPEAGVEWCESLGNAEEQHYCIRTICNQLAITDPARAMTLAEEHGGSEKNALAEDIMHHWPRKDLKAAMAWVENRQDPGLKDSLWNHLALSLAEIDPKQAANLAAERISSEKIQDEAVISVLHQWALKDRNAAAEWVELFPDGPLRERAKGEVLGSH
ncbi:hypothetical protein [Luteolibacter soli]|uniref:HEAT repeat domain-containing protein n=1 Tax=Luteolibacter soli TaxID=3135280 RepID=A0ABU9B0I0_9BACT